MATNTHGGLCCRKAMRFNRRTGQTKETRVKSELHHLQWTIDSLCLSFLICKLRIITDSPIIGIAFNELTNVKGLRNACHTSSTL